MVSMLLLGLCLLALPSSHSNAQGVIISGGGCIGCVESQCDQIPAILENAHNNAEDTILRDIAETFSCYRSWIAADTASDCPTSINYQGLWAAMMGMTKELTAVGMQQVFSIGKFIDAENQLETQRKFQELQFEAHKDYQPSEDFCRIGTTTRSLASSEQKTYLEKAILNSTQTARQLTQSDSPSAEGADKDLSSRWNNFRDHYCDPKDNNWTQASTDGLYFACGNKNTPNDRLRANIDIDYTRLIEQKRTLETESNRLSDDMTDVIALANNLYGHDLLTRQFTDNALGTDAGQLQYFQLRSVAARRNVAQNSFNSIAAMKTAGSDDLENNAAPFMHRILQESGITAEDAKELLGKNPSYYAQLELLSKKIYQNSNFFANLYDKPANVQRKATALKATDLMLDRSIFESELRQEMLLSVLLATKQGRKFRKTQNNLLRIQQGVEQ